MAPGWGRPTDKNKTQWKETSRGKEQDREEADEGAAVLLLLRDLYTTIDVDDNAYRYTAHHTLMNEWWIELGLVLATQK